MNVSFVICPYAFLYHYSHRDTTLGFFKYNGEGQSFSFFESLATHAGYSLGISLI